MRSTVCFWDCVLVLGGRSAPRTSDSQDDLEPLQGGWTMVLVFRNGEEVPADQAKSGELVIEDQDYRAKLGGKRASATIKVDSSKSPKEIDFTYTDGPRTGKTVKGIFKIFGDDLTICRGLTDQG